MSSYQLPNGREIFLLRWKIVGTYSGFEFGSKKSISFFTRRKLPKLAADLLPPGDPVVIIEPPEGDLPQWLCVAFFISDSSAHNSGADFGSHLSVCWFMEDLSRSLDEIIQSLLPQMDWENLAKDYDY